MHDALPTKLANPINLRLSITDSCNFRCAYCTPAQAANQAAGQAPSIVDSANLVTWLASRWPISRIKLTGGEPTTHSDLERLVALLAPIPGLEEISMTTNGATLARRAQSLRRAGLARINVSLDTLDPARFRDLTRGGRLNAVLDGIAAASRAGLTPLKLNAVLRRSTWREDVPALLDFAKDHGYELRFIELMRTGTPQQYADREFVSAATIRQWLESQVSCTSPDLVGSSPAREGCVAWSGSLVRVGWISPLSHPFCAACNRLRLDSRGVLRRCLMDPVGFALRRSLEQHGPENTMVELEAYLEGKTPPQKMQTSSTMMALGG